MICGKERQLFIIIILTREHLGKFVEKGALTFVAQRSAPILQASRDICFRSCYGAVFPLSLAKVSGLLHCCH